MSYEENLKSFSADADASVGIYTGVPGQPGSAVPNSGKQYCALQYTGKNQVGLATGAAQIVVGVLQNKPQRPGAAATVGYQGITNLLAGAPVDAGEEVVADATGRFVPGASTAGGLRFISQGIAAGAGELFPAQIV